MHHESTMYLRVIVLHLNNSLTWRALWISMALQYSQGFLLSEFSGRITTLTVEIANVSAAMDTLADQDGFMVLQNKELQNNHIFVY